MFKTAFKIEKNVPMPNRSRGRRKMYPLEKLRVGDSFLVPYPNGHKCAKHVYVPYTTAKKIGIDITARAENSGVRIWRIA